MSSDEDAPIQLGIALCIEEMGLDVKIPLRYLEKFRLIDYLTEQDICRWKFENPWTATHFPNIETHLRQIAKPPDLSGLENKREEPRATPEPHIISTYDLKLGAKPRKRRKYRGSCNAKLPLTTHAKTKKRNSKSKEKKSIYSTGKSTKQ